MQGNLLGQIEALEQLGVSRLESCSEHGTVSEFRIHRGGLFCVASGLLCPSKGSIRAESPESSVLLARKA